MFVIALTLLGIFAWRTLRQKKRAAAANRDSLDPAQDVRPYFSQKAELEAKEQRKYELEAKERVYEMEGKDAINEMGAGEGKAQVSRRLCV